MIAIPSFLLFLVSIPVHFEQLTVACGVECLEGQLTPQQLAELQNSGWSQEAYAAVTVTVSSLTTLAFCTVAVLIFLRRSNERMVLLVSLWMVTFGIGLGQKPEFPLIEPWARPILNISGELGWAVLLPVFLFTFPDGRFVPRWSRWLLLGYLVTGAVGATIQRVLPTGAPASPNPGELVLWMGMFLFGITSQVYRYRSYSSPPQRQQTKWIVFSLLAILAFLSSQIAAEQFDFSLNQLGMAAALESLLVYSLGTLSLSLIPTALFFSILRYRLYDIDLIIRRTVQYALITGILAMIYFAFVLLIQTVFRDLTGQESTLALVISTLAIAALFNPLRMRIQSLVDRRFYRVQYDAQQAVAQFAASTRSEVGMENLSRSLLSSVQKALQPEQVSLWLFSMPYGEGGGVKPDDPSMARRVAEWGIGG